MYRKISHSLIISILFSVIITITVSVCPAAEWLQPAQITDDNSEVMERFPCLAVDGNGIVHITYETGLKWDGFDVQHLYKDGREWKHSILTDNDAAHFFGELIADRANTVYFVDSGRTEPRGDMDVVFARWTDGAWSKPVSLFTDNVSQYDPDIAIDDAGNLHVTCHDKDRNIWYVTDKGGEWQEPVKVPTVYERSWHPAIGVDSDDNVHIVYIARDDDYQKILGYTSLNKKGEWSEPKKLVVASGEIQHPKMAVRNNEVHLIFSAGRWDAQDINYMNAVRGRWSKVKNISNNNMDCDRADLSIDPQGNVHVAYEGGYGGNEGDLEIYYANNIGGKWSRPQVITNDNIFEYGASIEIDGSGFAHVAFFGWDGDDFEIFYSRSAKPVVELPRKISSK